MVIIFYVFLLFILSTSYYLNRPSINFQKLSSIRETFKFEENQTNRLKVLCLHGYLSNSVLFQHQLRSITSKTSEFIDYVFINAPNEFSMASKKVQSNQTVDSNLKRKYRWWTLTSMEDNIIYQGVEESIQTVMDVYRRHGSFDVVLGHSQGACLLLLVDLLLHDEDFLENVAINFMTQMNGSINNRELSALIPRFRILISGFVPRDSIYGNRIQQNINNKVEFGLRLPSLHIFNGQDTVNPMENSIEVLSLYESPQMLYQEEGGHDLPVDDETTNYIADNLYRVWQRKFKPTKILLED